MYSRLLVCVVLLSSAMIIVCAGREEASTSCATTLPPNPSFVPPSPYRQDATTGRFWYGTESLWTLLDVPGTWRMGGGKVYTTKLMYWRRGFDWRKEPEPKLLVTATRLDREAPSVAAEHANAVFVTGPQPAAMVTGIDIPTTGCWKLTAQYRDQKLSFVVSVQP